MEFALTDEQMMVLWAVVGLVLALLVVLFGMKLLRQKKAPPREVEALPRVEEKPLREKLEEVTARPVPAPPEVLQPEAVKPQPVPAKPLAPFEAPVEVPVVVEKEVDLKKALRATEENIFGRIKSLFKSNESFGHLEEIEEVLYTSDLGPQTVQKLMEALEDLNKKEKADFAKVRETLKFQMEEVFSKLPSNTLHFAENGPTVLMIVGVNGAGKTTSIGKLASQFASQGKKVLVAAGDTFRAAAGGQLKVWTERAHVEIFSPQGVTDPSAVAFDAISKAKGQNYDIVIVDTAGRLHTQENLMEELKKMKRVMGKVIPEAPHEVIIVLDANSGQNALIQAKEYHKALQLTGAILTKMDGTAKGGVAVGLANELQIPIKFIGVGERIQDLRHFSPHEFVESIFS